MTGGRIRHILPLRTWGKIWGQAARLCENTRKKSQGAMLVKTAMLVALRVVSQCHKHLRAPQTVASAQILMPTTTLHNAHRDSVPQLNVIYANLGEEKIRQLQHPGAFASQCCRGTK
jgi:hypothetical protein